MSRWRTAPVASALVAVIGIAACSAEPSPSATAPPATEPSGFASAPPSVRPTVRPSVAVVPTRAPSPTPNLTTYVIKKGDTLWAIANQFDVSLAALREANPQITDPTRLRVGAELTIPSQ